MAAKLNQAPVQRASGFVHSTVLPLCYGDELKRVIEKWIETVDAEKQAVFALPHHIYRASGGGSPDTIVPLSGYWIMALLAARLLDDYFDGDNSLKVAPAVRASSLGLACYSLANVCLAYIESGVLGPIMKRLTMAFVRASEAQCSLPTPVSFDDHIDLTLHRNCAPFGALAWSAARLATSDPLKLALAERFCQLLSARDMLRDDCLDFIDDTHKGRITLPHIHARAVLDVAGIGLDVAEKPTAPLLDGDEIGVEQVKFTKSLVWTLQVASNLNDKAATLLEALAVSRIDPLWHYVYPPV